MKVGSVEVIVRYIVRLAIGRGSMFLRMLLVAVMAFALSGCFVMTVNGEMPNRPAEEIGGNYFINQLNSGDLSLRKEAFYKSQETKALFEKNIEAIGISVTITHTKVKGHDLRWYEVLNTLAASLTWFAWPISVRGDTDRYFVEVSSVLGVETATFDVVKTRWTSLLSPLGLAPAVFADEKVYGDDPAVDKCEDASNKVAMKMAIVAVKSTLKKGKYDAYLARKRKAQIEAMRQAAEADARKRDLHKEELLRKFALKEAPMVWKAVQDLQANISQMEANLAALKKELRDFGRDPEKDQDVVRLVQMHADMKASLDVLYQKLRDAYIASKKYEATPGRRDYEALRRKTIDDGIQEAELVVQRFKMMGESR